MKIFKFKIPQVFAPIIHVVAVPAYAWVCALATRDLWSYFVVPTFDVPKLTVWQAFGVVFFVAWLRSPNVDQYLTASRVGLTNGRVSAIRWVTTLVYWGAGALIFHFFGRAV